MRILTIVLLVLHGLIHLLGCAKEWHLLALPEMSGRTSFALPEGASKLVGGAWLVACLLLLSAALSLLVQHGPWWLPALSGLALSQLLVIYAWPDAKAGTVLNLLLLLPALVAMAQGHFERGSRALVQQLFAQAPGQGEPVQAAELERLPAVVRGWLVASGVVGKPRVRTVRLRQRGELRASAEGAFMPVRASQYFRVDQPGFVWAADVTMLRVLPLSGRDSYLAGHGHMLISLGALFPVVDAGGPQIDEGTLQRYLAEMVWFPSAALDPRIVWRDEGERAEATLIDHGIKAAVSFQFDAQGRFRQLTALRFKESGPAARRERWLVTAHAWRELSGRLVPVSGDVRWQLASGELTVYRWHVDELEYDRSELFAD